MYENVHPSLALVLLFVRTDVECGKGPLKFARLPMASLVSLSSMGYEQARRLLGAPSWPGRDEHTVCASGSPYQSST